jgi:hypothetical protein
VRRTLAIACLAVLALAGTARAADGPLDFTTVKLQGAGGGTEPRITVAPDGTWYADTNGADGEIVFRSRDEGQSWTRTPADPPQTAASIDVDTIAMPTGRILASELDYGGLNFPTGVTDDGGKTWTESVGPKLVDQDRQWFAAGPNNRVYMLYHNFASGVPQHNMWVTTSTDGGEHFGPPVPTAQPGSDAYLDLQCSDSGGPSNIAVQPNGRIWVFFTTRAGVVAPGGPDFGGCFAQPLEFNIVNGTRVWAATSPDGSPGSWKDYLAVDDAPTGQVVSMQLAYGALDNQNGVYVAYPESPKPYPDIGGAAVKLVYQKADAKGELAGKWSAPKTLVPANPDGTFGSTLVHLAVGDPGKIAVAYYKGEPVPGADKPVWYTHVLHSQNVLAANPTVIDQKVADIPAYKWTASEMMGICAEPSPIQGPENGLLCDRSTDVWGITLDQQCRLGIVWPTQGPDSPGGPKGVFNGQAGTFVSAQTGGVTLCGSNGPGAPYGITFQPDKSIEGAPGGAGGGSASGGCVDRVAPESRLQGRVRATRRGLDVRGSSVDLGCNGGKARVRQAASLRVVRVAVARRLANRRCRFLLGDLTFGPARSCLKTVYITTRGRSSWSFSAKTALARGRYTVWARGVDVFGNVERKTTKRNFARFNVR